MKTASLTKASLAILTLLSFRAFAVDTVVCVSEGSVNVRNDALSEVLFTAAKGDKVVLAEKNKITREINGAPVTFVFAQFVEQERDGWISELYVRPADKCPGVDTSANPPAPKPASGQVKIIYFGGYLATNDQVDCWKAGALKKLPPNYAITAYPWPAGAGSGYESAVNGGANYIKKAVAEIDANKDVMYIVVGHSSGAALSNSVVERVKDLSHVKLVNLDGFAPSASLQKKLKAAHPDPASVCVTARNSQNGTKARNYGSMTGNCSHSWVYEDKHCTTSWCLHFAIVSKSTPGGLGVDFPRNGYKGCDANLDWMKELQ